MKTVVIMGHNYSRPFFYRGVEWTILNPNLSDDQARKYIDNELMFISQIIVTNKDCIDFMRR